MNRLPAYLMRQFFVQAASLFVVAAFLVWITQALRLFDLITAKGQDMLTLAGQAFLTTPPLSRAIIYICMGIGLARVFRAMQTSRELHSIHAGGRTSAIWQAVAGFAIGGALLVTFIAHWLEPLSNTAYRQWSAEITADLVGRTLTPNTFTEVSPGFVVVISGRAADGTVLDFFADDTRDPEMRRTYTARSAVIVSDDDGYYLNLQDGTLQFFRAGVEFSEIQFSSYELALDSLAQEVVVGGGIKDELTHTILGRAWARGHLSSGEWIEMNRRVTETLLVLALCLFVASVAAFPDAGRGRKRLPLEVTVLIVALGVRVLGEVNRLGFLGYCLAPLLLLTASALLLGWRVYGFHLIRFLPHHRRRVAA